MRDDGSGCFPYILATLLVFAIWGAFGLFAWWLTTL